METKDYEKRVKEVKLDIINEMANILGATTYAVHDFKERFNIHYIENDVAITETCYCAEISTDGDFGIYATSESDFRMELEDCIEQDRLLLCDTSSLISVLEHLKKEIREEKLSTLRKLVSDAGGEIKFDGNFEFFGTRGTTVQKTKLMGVEIDDKGEFMFDCIAAEDGECWRDDRYPDTDQIDNIIEYVRKQTAPKKKPLTDKQKELVEEFRDLVKRMQHDGIAFIRRNEDDGIHFVNNEDAKYFDAIENGRTNDEILKELPQELLSEVPSVNIVDCTYWECDGQTVVYCPK